MAARTGAGRRASEIALLALVAVFGVWLAADAAARSSAVENLVLILPVAALMVGVAAWLAVAALRAPAAAAQPSPPGFALQVAGLLLLLVLLVYGLETVGFDAASFVFLLAGTWLLGERRVVPLLLFAGVVTVVVVLALRTILPFPVPTLLL